MAKEVAAFNVRALYISLGAFDTNMPAAAVAGEDKLDGDYSGTIVGKTISVMATNDWVPPGDHLKAANAIYQVVSGKETDERRGFGDEVHLVLGSDALKRVEEVRDKLQHTLDVFGDLARSVDRGI